MTSTKEKVLKPFCKAGISVVFNLGKIGMRIPYTRRKIKKKVSEINRSDWDTFGDTLFSDAMYKTIVQCAMTYINKKVKKNKEVPYFTFYQLHGDSYEEISLKSVQRPGVPLVINFGSNSWPPFVAESASFSELAQKYGEKADFIFVYIVEAHPIGGWEFQVRKYSNFVSKNDKTISAHTFVYEIRKQSLLFIGSTQNRKTWNDWRSCQRSNGSSGEI